MRKPAAPGSDEGSHGGDGGRGSSRVPGPAGVLGEALAAQDERLSLCVHCGFCLPACPTYVRLGDEADSPRGRLHLMGAVAEGRLDPASDAFQRHIDRCLGCRACETVCPSGVEYGFLLERAREVAVGARRPGLLTRLLLGTLGRPVPFRLWMWSSRAFRATGLPALLARVLPGRGPLGRIRFALAMLAASAPARLRAPARPGGTEGHGGVSVSAEEQWRQTGTASMGSGSPPGRVALLTGCVQSHLFRRVNRATRRVLRANGWEVVDVPGQGCCGALHAHGGRLETAREMARRNLGVFQAAGADWIGVNAAGCGAAMREYVHLLEGGAPEEGEEARQFSGRVRDVTELLAGEGREPRRGASLPLRAAYDPPCHLLHAQGVREAPIRMLRAVPGLQVTALANGEECCGGAGIYGITHPDLGGRIGADKVEAVRESGAHLLATGNPGCMMQIGAGLRIAGLDVGVVHPVELLDESYRRAGLYAT